MFFIKGLGLGIYAWFCFLIPICSASRIKSSEKSS